MLDTHHVLCLIILVSSLTGACPAPRQEEYDIDKTSPNGSYRVKISVTPGERGKSVDKAKFQFFEGQEIIETWNWEQQDQWEPSFESFRPIEWIGNNILHMGKVCSNEDFCDELIVFNATDQNLKYVSINYGRFESFRVFNLNSGSQVTLSATPWFTVEGGEFWFSYRGLTRDGKAFGDVVKSGERKSSADGPRRFKVTINMGDL